MSTDQLRPGARVVLHGTVGYAHGGGVFIVVDGAVYIAGISVDPAHCTVVPPANLIQKTGALRNALRASGVTTPPLQTVRDAVVAGCTTVNDFNAWHAAQTGGTR